jgi:DNA-binding winged helix-turn-helix (wHTH) protein/predicted ATPase
MVGLRSFWFKIVHPDSPKEKAVEQRATVITFGPFRLFPVQRKLWKDEEQIEVRTMPLAVLTYLAQHPERVVPIEEVHKAVWGSTSVSRTTIRVCVREIRQILGDEVAIPRYIETVGRQGYCFIGYNSTELSAGGDRSVAVRPQGLATESVSLPEPFVGRQRELTQLRRRFAQAQQGQRQVVLVSGEPGIGKTTLLQQFVAQLPATGSVWVGRGQCVESYGLGEAYLPVLEAVGRLGRELETGKLVAVLHQHAPTWLTQLPVLVDIAAREELHRQVAGATPERMLRELCDALEVLTAEQMLILVLEDLHWSDTATLAWIAAVARRPNPARLLVIGSYQPTDVVTRMHPLRGFVQELRAHRLCEDIHLEVLSVDEVQEYVRQRFASSAAADELGLRLHQRTDGNPLFLTASVDVLIRQGLVVEEGGRWVVRGDLTVIEDTVPEDLQQLITKQIEGLSVEEQQVLEAASVSGLTFTAAGVAAGCKQKPEAVEEVCERLAQRGRVIEGGRLEEWPDGTLTARYSFRHAFFRDVLYQRPGDRQRLQLHRAIAERLEVGYGERAREIASNLAGHWTQGRDYHKVARYHLHAADNALRLSAYREALTHCQQGLRLLAHLPATSERDRQELAIRMSLHVALGAVHGLGTQEVEENLKQAQELARKVNDEKALVSMVVALGRVYVARADRAGALRIAEEDSRLVEQVRDPALAIQLHTQLGTIHTYCAEYAQARVHQMQALTLSTTAGGESLSFSSGLDPLMLVYSLFSLGLWLSGWLDQSKRQYHNLLTRAAQLEGATSSVNASINGAVLALLRGDLGEARQLADQGVRRAREHGSSMYSAMGMVVQGCITVQGGDLETGIDLLKKALQDYRATSAQTLLPIFLSFLAEALSRCGKSEEAFATIAEALRLAETSLEVCWEAELYRMKGELTLAQSSVQSPALRVKKSGQSKVKSGKLQVPSTQHPTPSIQAGAEAEACFHKAIEIARKQQAKSLELRAVMSLSRLWQSQGKKGKARQMLAEIYNWFTEGFDTKDLQEAKALLEELRGR